MQLTQLGALECQDFLVVYSSLWIFYSSVCHSARDRNSFFQIQNSNHCKFIPPKFSPRISGLQRYANGNVRILVIAHLSKNSVTASGCLLTHHLFCCTDDRLVISGDQIHFTAEMTPFICAGCKAPIMERYLMKVLDKSWHVQCVKCSECHCLLSEKCFSRETKLYCRSDFFK